jgi:hypothetical protein
VPKKTKNTEEHRQTIEYLLAGLLLKKEVDIKKVAKIIGCSDKTLTSFYPEKRRGKINERKENTEN